MKLPKSLLLPFLSLSSNHPPPTHALNGDATQTAFYSYNGWKNFEIITQGDQVPTGDGYIMRGKNDGLGAHLTEAGDEIRVLVNHESHVGGSCDSNPASVSEVLLDKAKLQVAINNVIQSASGSTGGVSFVNSIGRAYDLFRNKDGMLVSSFGGREFERFCSGQVFEADTYGPNIGFVDRLYIFGEEVSNNDGRIFVIHEKTLYLVSGNGSGNAATVQGGFNGIAYDSLENAALVSTGEEDHVALFLSPDFGSEALKMYIGKKGFKTDGQGCGACSGDENLLARNGLAFGSWFYLQGSFPNSETNSGSFGTSINSAILYAKHEDVDTNPLYPNRAILANQREGVFEFDFTFDFSGPEGSFDYTKSDFTIKKVIPLSEVIDPDNVEWCVDGSILVNNDNSAGTIQQYFPDTGTIIQIATTLGSGESSGVIDISHLLDYDPASIILTNSMVCPASVSLLINPNAGLGGSPTKSPSPTSSPMPTRNPDTTLPLLIMGDNGGENFPLGRCEGDCDNHDQCQTGLLCYQRGGTEPVPGCDGTGISGKDYCAEKNDNLFISGNNGNPSSSFPLGICEGDCDNDGDCADGLVCFERSGMDVVPGCAGLGVYGKDYCYDPNLSSPTSSSTSPPSSTPTNPIPSSPTYQPSKSPTKAPSSTLPLVIMGDNGGDNFPLGRCEGDCDNHDQCQSGLLCYQRGGTEPVPGCDGTGISGKDYCAEKKNNLFISGNNGNPSSSFPLGICEGDCDNDGDCADGLVCFERSGMDVVPGCAGLGVYGKDYCYDPNLFARKRRRFRSFI